MSIGKGFGKTILIGDQFVLYGVPAIVSSLPYASMPASLVNFCYFSNSPSE